MAIGAIGNLTERLTSLFPNPTQSTSDANDFAALLSGNQPVEGPSETGQQSAEDLLRALGNQSNLIASQLKTASSSDAQPLKLTSLQIDLEGATQQFGERLEQLLRENGIDPNIGFEISADLNGQPVVKSEHPQQKELNELFENNPELSNLFRKMSTDSEILQVAAEHEAFAIAYEQDPDEAMELFEHLFQPSGFRNFGLKYDQRAVEVFNPSTSDSQLP
ncbi:hypothetical protein Pla110_46050 [Polystyrenella longa]|uniref:Uncharacterized protein n=1 Tax=Polystyrenella longa TaxID=2528007 RepID=A0A518CUE8_9PLAN|nr:hypothetical protein [Polystyrenella longa]QDU82842.1 hypothetical protein Pla110_46050 [Polystyrenella longa]